MSLGTRATCFQGNEVSRQRGFNLFYVFYLFIYYWTPHSYQPMAGLYVNLLLQVRGLPRQGQITQVVISAVSAISAPRQSLARDCQAGATGASKGSGCDGCQ